MNKILIKNIREILFHILCNFGLGYTGAI